ncbi:hypothetical protein PQJ75_16245 [Rhodoplanes sp. TEM]|uniref:Lipoprotein n=1 Tax=Rhodoplanes tepidamans TaxID=200616 RepID=A0ABT5JC62_RHOTP|nr:MULTISPECIES: hypothetical protein [Rhodoplanes]MDC7787258.1 hypothetical protein [Rhodoplanes tepidamans]MDC7985286.1 hypothetical protein [Rhodoplanes sp. TEM]MDQ0357793.1 hypothetical protein [Rhodoplanes tepidamans]
MSRLTARSNAIVTAAALAAGVVGLTADAGAGSWSGRCWGCGPNSGGYATVYYAPGFAPTQYRPAPVYYAPRYYPPTYYPPLAYAPRVAPAYWGYYQGCCFAREPFVGTPWGWQAADTGWSYGWRDPWWNWRRW